MPMHPPGRNHTQTLKEDREAVILADRLGFCEAFIGEHATDVCESIPSCLAFIASVVDQLLAFREAVGDFGTLLYAGHDWADAKLARRSMELMAERVMPAVNAAIGAAAHAA